MTRKTPKAPPKNPRISDEILIEAIRRARGNVSLAARAAGVSRTTINNRLEASPALKAAFDEEREVVVDQLEGVLLKKALDGDLDAIKTCLKHWGKPRGWLNDRAEPSSAPININITPYKPRE